MTGRLSFTPPCCRVASPAVMSAATCHTACSGMQRRYAASMRIALPPTRTTCQLCGGSLWPLPPAAGSAAHGRSRGSVAAALRRRAVLSRVAVVQAAYERTCGPHAAACAVCDVSCGPRWPAAGAACGSASGRGCGCAAPVRGPAGAAAHALHAAPTTGGPSTTDGHAWMGTCAKAAHACSTAVPRIADACAGVRGVCRAWVCASYTWHGGALVRGQAAGCPWTVAASTCAGDASCRDTPRPCGAGVGRIAWRSE